MRCRRKRRPLCCTGGTRSVGSAAVRSSRLRRAELRSGRWTFRSSLRSDLHVHRPTLRICPPSPFLTLSAPPRSLGQKAVPGTVSQSLDVICAVSAQAPSALVKLPSSWLLLGRRRLSLPPVALPLSSSLASPPPSLRSGTSPQGDLCVFLGCACRHSGTACGAAYISARTKSGWVRFCAVWATPSAGRSANM